MTTTIERRAATRTFLTDVEIHEHIVRYKAGDERAIVPVVEHFKDQARRQALRAARDTNGKIDASDVESAIVASLFETLDRFDPSLGVPFGGFFKQFRRAAVHGERARLSGRSALRRKTFDTRGRVLRAAEELKKELAARATAAAPDQPRRRPPLYRLADAFTDQDARDLAAADDACRTAALSKLLLDVDGYLLTALPEGTPADARRALALDKLKPLCTAARSRTRGDVESTLAASLTYAVTRAGRAVTATQVSPAEFYAMVGDRAGVSADLARDLLEDDSTVSLDADSSKSNASGKGGVLGDRVGATDGEQFARRDLFGQFGAVLDLAPDFPRFAYALHHGLHGYGGRSIDQIAAGLGMSTTQADLAIRQARSVVQSAAVADLLFGRGREALVAQDPMADVLRAAAEADRLRTAAERSIIGATGEPSNEAPSRPATAGSRRFASIADAMAAAAAIDGIEGDDSSEATVVGAVPGAEDADDQGRANQVEALFRQVFAPSTAAEPDMVPDPPVRAATPSATRTPPAFEDAVALDTDGEDDIPPRRRIAEAVAEPETTAEPAAEQGAAPLERDAIYPPMKQASRADQFSLFDVLS